MVLFAGKKKVSLFVFLFCFSASYVQAIDQTPYFIENKGQVIDQFNKPNNDVLFLFTGKGIKLQLRRSGYSYELLSFEGLPLYSNNAKKKLDLKAIKPLITKCNRVDVDFVDAAKNIQVVTSKKSYDYQNYYTNGAQITKVYAYSSVVYRNIYKNTDIEFFLTNDQNSPFKYNII